MEWRPTHHLASVQSEAAYQPIFGGDLERVTVVSSESSVFRGCSDTLASITSSCVIQASLYLDSLSMTRRM